MPFLYRASLPFTTATATVLTRPLPLSTSQPHGGSDEEGGAPAPATETVVTIPGCISSVREKGVAGASIDIKTSAGAAKSGIISIGDKLLHLAVKGNGCNMMISLRVSSLDSLRVILSFLSCYSFI
jgi:hypothetical protein